MRKELQTRKSGAQIKVYCTFKKKKFCIICFVTMSTQQPASLHDWILSSQRSRQRIVETSQFKFAERLSVAFAPSTPGFHLLSVADAPLTRPPRPGFHFLSVADAPLTPPPDPGSTSWVLPMPPFPFYLLSVTEAPSTPGYHVLHLLSFSSNGESHISFPSALL